jgi:hypothetical protein
MPPAENPSRSVGLPMETYSLSLRRRAGFLTEMAYNTGNITGSWWGCRIPGNVDRPFQHGDPVTITAIKRRVAVLSASASDE